MPKIRVQYKIRRFNSGRVTVNATVYRGSKKVKAQQRLNTRLLTEMRRHTPVKTGNLVSRWRTSHSTYGYEATNPTRYAAAVDVNGKSAGYVKRGIEAWAKRVRADKKLQAETRKPLPKPTVRHRTRRYKNGRVTVTATVYRGGKKQKASARRMRWLRTELRRATPAGLKKGWQVTKSAFGYVATNALPDAAPKDLKGSYAGYVLRGIRAWIRRVKAGK